MLRIAAIGECMLELRHRDADTLALGCAGDSFNTALYLARCNPPERLAVDYVTALGDDPYSDAMLEFWRAEGVGTAAVARLSGRLPGLYLIRTGEDGERQFFYYRSAAAARELFAGAETLPLLDALPAYDLLYFTAVTLSILAPAARRRFTEVLQQARQAGRQVVFDSNYRPAGWPDAAAARAAIEAVLGALTMALPTFEDEQALWGDADPAVTLARYAQLGIETVVKCGNRGCVLAAGIDVAVPQAIAPVDTTGAGDAFNAAYLTARLGGYAPAEAARAGHILAGEVIQHRGAIMPGDLPLPAFPGLMRRPRLATRS